MLTELRIQNFAILEQVNLRFGPGLIIFTGETGAGKSILIDAVEILLGGRVDTTMIRSGAEWTNVEGDFFLPPAIRPAVQAILAREELLENGDDYVTLAREIRLQGRNVARIDGRSVSVSLLKEVGEYLVDIHGQSEHLSLLRVREHLRLLDGLATVEQPLAAYQAAYTRLRLVRQSLEALREAERDAARRADLLAYQIDEIEKAHLTPGEEDKLRQERNRLANAESLSKLAQEALFTLDEGAPETPSITDLLGSVVEALQTLARTDPSQAALGEQTQALFDGLTDLTLELRDYLEGVEFNPRRLEQLEIRLDLIHNLKRKYGGSIPEILAFAEKAREQLEEITNAEARTAELEAEEARLQQALAKHGMALSTARHTASGQLSRALEAELAELKMAGAHFAVDFQMRPDQDGVLLPDGQRVAFDSQGLESVQFLVAPNPGEGLKPLAKIASGGEMSRLMLALKNVLARADLTPTLIFDEIDQGIGGRVGAVVGQKLWRLGREHQVFCVTHLPQLAAFGGQHYRVQKVVRDKRTTTVVELLEGDSRLRELAMMLGEVSEGTQQSARELLENAGQMQRA